MVSPQLNLRFDRYFPVIYWGLPKPQCKIVVFIERVARAAAPTHAGGNPGRCRLDGRRMRRATFHRERRIPVRRGRSRHEAEQFYIRFCFPDAATADAFRSSGSNLLETLDAKAAADVAKRIQAAQADAGGRNFRTGGGKVVGMEGPPPPQRVAIAEWDNLEKSSASSVRIRRSGQSPRGFSRSLLTMRTGIPIKSVGYRRFRCRWGKGSHSWPLAANATEEVLAAWCAEARLGPRTIRAPGCFA